MLESLTFIECAYATDGKTLVVLFGLCRDIFGRIYSLWHEVSGI